MDLFAANDITDSLAPWYKTANILGILPQGITQKKLKISWIGIISSLFFYFYFTYTFVIYMPHLSTQQAINQYISFIDYLLYRSLFAGIYLSSTINAKKFFRIIKKISEIDILFKSMNVYFSYEKIKKRLIIKLLLSFIILVAFQILNWNFANFLFYLNFFLIVHFIAEVFRLFILIKTDTILKVLKNRFEAVNRCVKNLSKENFKVCERICKLKFIHDELCDICEMLNDVESVPIMCSLAGMFLMIMTNGYYFYSYWYNYKENLLNRLLIGIVISSRYIVYGIMLIPGFVNLAKEANQTGILLHKTIGTINDAEIQRQLMIFSNQLLHRRVEFTAKGFFQINYAFIFSIFGTITAYLVILIQFQNLTPRDPSNTAGFDLT